jgi:hypothetical protein
MRYGAAQRSSMQFSSIQRTVLVPICSQGTPVPSTSPGRGRVCPAACPWQRQRDQAAEPERSLHPVGQNVPRGEQPVVAVQAHLAWAAMAYAATLPRASCRHRHHRRGEEHPHVCAIANARDLNRRRNPDPRTTALELRAGSSRSARRRRPYAYHRWACLHAESASRTLRTCTRCTAAFRVAAAFTELALAI